MNMVELEQRLRRTYEWSRLRHATLRAFWLFTPVALLIAISPRAVIGVLLGLSLLAASIVLWWRGGLLARAVVPGLAAGAIPFAMASLAMKFSPGCSMDGHCLSWCVPACACGGAIAAALIARRAPRSPDAYKFWLGAGLVANLTGALGCSCYSMAGTFALTVAFIGISAPAFAISQRSAR